MMLSDQWRKKKKKKKEDYDGGRDGKGDEERMEKPLIIGGGGKMARLYTRCLVILLSVALWWLLFVFQFSVNESRINKNSNGNSDDNGFIENSSLQNGGLPSPQLGVGGLGNRRALSKEEEEERKRKQPFWPALASMNNKSDPCGGRYVYMHDLPPEFNQKLTNGCRNITSWTNMCKYLAGEGLGLPLDDPLGIFIPKGTWFATEMFIADVIFHSRMKRYKCLTRNSTLASLMYVPFYAGLEITQHLWGAGITERDAATTAISEWLQSQPEWGYMGGEDHFLVAGRVTWDFRRLTDEEADWGTKLLVLPSLMKVAILLVEVSPWQTHDFAVPYPTYFHPKQDSDIIEWQNKVRAMNRSSLFSFAGAPRPEMAASIRGQIIEQCSRSDLCKLLDCHEGVIRCHTPTSVMTLFLDSVFCLQPPGDSYTRRSTFDSMVAGCIPVFFHEQSAYTQYVWHLPLNRTSYSVFISEDDIRDNNVSIEAVLRKIPPHQVKSMREEVIKLIPGFLYAHPDHNLQTMKDAFDLTIEALIKNVTDRRIEIALGLDEQPNEENGGNGVESTDISNQNRENSEQSTKNNGGSSIAQMMEEAWRKQEEERKAAKLTEEARKRQEEERKAANLMKDAWRRQEEQRESTRLTEDA